MTKELTLNKAVAALVGVAMAAGLAFAFAAERAHAVTLSELVELFIALEVIPADKADEARSVLASQGSETPAPGGAAMACNFTRNLASGATGADVMELQKFLNAKGYTVAAAGAGSAGMETQYYGPATAAAVSKLQVAFASEILTPLGLTSGTGFFGAATRAKANSLCSSAGPVTPPVTPGDDDDDMEPGDDDDDDDTLSGGEASLEKFDALNDPSNEDLSEGDEDAEVFGFEFDVEDGDVKVNRIDVNFQSQTLSAEDEPWNSIDSVALMIDGEKVAEEDASDEDAWDDQGDDTYRIRFTDIDNAVFNEDETAEIVVAVTVSDGIDDSDLPQEWKVWVPANGLRAIDGADLDQYTGSNSESETFTIEAAGEDTELKITTASSNPDSSTIKVDDNDNTDDVTVLSFNVEADQGEAELRRVVVFATTSAGEVLSDIVSDVKLEIDGTTYDYDVVGAATTSTSSGTGLQGGFYIFNLASNDDEINLEADEKVEAKLLVDFLDTNNGARYANGTTIEFDVNADARSGWQADDESGNALLNGDGITGTGNGEQHTLQATGIFAEVVSVDADLVAEDGASNDKATYVVKFDVTAFEEDAYIGKASARNTGTNGVVFQIEDDSDAPVAANGTTTQSFTNTSGADSDGAFWIVRDGETESFTLSVTYEPITDGVYRVQLLEVNFNDTAASGDTLHTPAPEEDFETDTVIITDRP